MANTEKELDITDEASKKDIVTIKDAASLQKFQIKYLGRKSKLTSLLRSIKEVPKAKRADFGKKANSIKHRLEEEISKKKEEITVSTQLAASSELDVTEPGIKRTIGHIHPITQMRWQVEEIFERMGFEAIEPYEVDDDYHNFTSLNMPENHPARDMWDTFWTEEGFIPITQTSAMQNRILKSRPIPVRAIVIGKVFRNERTDPRHEHTLYQCEGIYVDKGISLAHMIGTLQTFFNEFFGKKVEVQVTPEYFPFVEPGNGMALSCVICDMKGCRVCKYTGWLEILGCGMIHPNVLKEAGVDPNVYSGFAWGFGLDRLVMLKYGIEDVRHFHSGDLRFLHQF